MARSRTMKHLVPALVAVSMAAAPAIAGDWSGAYLGLGVGYGDVDGPGARDGEAATFGGHIGYNFDLGNRFVMGGELEYDRVNNDLGGGGGTLDEIGRLKVKAGYDFGPVLGYGVLGAARATSTFGNENGLVYGLGLAMPVTDYLSVSGEALRHQFKDFGGAGSDFDVNTFNLRASLRF
ncbi:porin family protein [Ruegeria pomeroyi]|nr:porin family protein [Ruegeria pomeroyi]